TTLAELGADYLQIRPVFMLGLQLSPAMQERMERGIAEAQRLQSEGFDVHVLAHRFEQVASGQKPFSLCLGHNLIGVVGADATAYLCCQWRGDPRYAVGHLERHSFRDMWEGPRRRDVAASVNVDACPPCRYSTYNRVLESLADRSEKHEAFL
ncbi:MAG: SPASM domain-containing protein, partial [Armatimonadota bacterium]